MNTHTNSNAQSVYLGIQAVWLLLGFIEVLLAFRFILKLLAANTTAAFTNAMYTLTDVLVAPFTSVFRTSYGAGSTFEWTTLLAAIVYFAIAAGIINLFLMGEDVTTREANIRLRNQE